MSLTRPQLPLRDRLLRMSPNVLRLVAHRWFLAGYRAATAAQHPEVTFKKLWAERKGTGGGIS